MCWLSENCLRVSAVLLDVGCWQGALLFLTPASHAAAHATTHRIGFAAMLAIEIAMGKPLI